MGGTLAINVAGHQLLQPVCELMGEEPVIHAAYKCADVFHFQPDSTSCRFDSPLWLLSFGHLHNPL